MRTGEAGVADAAVAVNDDLQEASRVRRQWRGRTPVEWATAYGAPVVLAILIAIFSLLLPETYPTIKNIQAILGSESVVLLVSLGLLLPAVVGEFDLSVGSMVAFAAVELALLVSHGMALPLAVLITMCSSAVVGLVSGFLVVAIGINSFIATLAMSTLLSGGSLWLSGGQAISSKIPESVTSFGQGSAGGIPLPAIYAVGFAIVLWFVLGHTPIGRHLYATGGNRLAAELSGVRTRTLVLGAFVIAAFVAGGAGVVTMMRSGSGDPAVGPELLLPSFAAIFLGSTTIVPGRFNVVGTVIGILLVACGVSGMEQLGASSFVVPLFNGGVLIIAVGISRLFSRSRSV